MQPPLYGVLTSAYCTPLYNVATTRCVGTGTANHQQALYSGAVFAAGAILPSTTRGTQAVVLNSPPSGHVQFSAVLYTCQGLRIVPWCTPCPTTTAQGLRFLSATSIKPCICTRPVCCLAPTNHRNSGSGSFQRSCHPLYHHVRCLHPRLQSLHPLHLLWSSVARPSGQPDKTATCDTKEEPAASGGGDGTAIMQQSPLRMAAVGCVPVLLQSRDTLRADMISDNDRTSQHRNADLRYHANCLKLLQLLTFASMQCCMVSQLLTYLL